MRGSSSFFLSPVLFFTQKFVARPIKKNKYKKCWPVLKTTKKMLVRPKKHQKILARPKNHQKKMLARPKNHQKNSGPS